MLFLNFLFGMVGGWMVHVLVQYRRGENARTASFKSGAAIGGTDGLSNRPLSKSPEWEEVRKIPGQIFWTMVAPLFVMTEVSSDTTDLAAWLIVTCMVLYVVLKFSFTVAGEFLPWGPEGSITTRKRLIKAAELYMKAKYSEIPKEERLSLTIEETSKRPLHEASVSRMFDSSDCLYRHHFHYGRTRDGMTEFNPRKKDAEKVDLTLQVSSEEDRVLQMILAKMRSGAKAVVLGLSDIDQLKSSTSDEIQTVLENANIKPTGENH
jgi:hypothetical protein